MGERESRVEIQAIIILKTNPGVVQIWRLGWGFGVEHLRTIIFPSNMEMLEILIN